MKATFYFIFFIPIISFAQWPTFATPDKDFLIKNHFLVFDGCSKGKAKILPLKINIHKDRCKTFCPTDWSWILKDDGRCHDLSKDFDFLNFTISHTREDNGNTNNSTVIAQFGDFKFMFESTPHQAWYCVEANPEMHTIMCANDV